MKFHRKLLGWLAIMQNHLDQKTLWMGYARNELASVFQTCLKTFKGRAWLHGCNICVTSVRFSNLLQSTLCVNRVLEKSTELVINILKNKQKKKKKITLRSGKQSC